EPWPSEAPFEQPEALTEAYALVRLDEMDELDLEAPLKRLTLLFAEQLWSFAPDSHHGVAQLFDVLRSAGHPLLPFRPGFFGSLPFESTGLCFTIAPTSLRLSFGQPSRRRIVVTIAHDEPMHCAVRC